MTAYSIIITPAAERDLDDIWFYVAENDLPAKADDLSDTLEERCLSLEQFPERGRLLRSASKFGFTDFREIYHRPYRIIYKIIHRHVVIYGVLDSRRDLEQVLHKRLSQAIRQLV